MKKLAANYINKDDHLRKSNSVKLYNILLPLWLIIFLPSYLWLALIPLNYLIDRVVLKWSLGDKPYKGVFCRNHTWKICLAGFFSDFVGAAIMLAVSIPIADHSEALYDIAHAIMFDPFSDLRGLLIVVACIAVSAVCIYFIDRLILDRAGLDPEQVNRAAIRLALITAPYLYLFPSRLLYESGILG